MPSNPAFSDDFQIAWDSISRGALKKCPRYYQYSILEGYTLKLQNGFSSSIDLIFGIWFHSAREIYYRNRANGNDHEEALEKALDYVLKVTWNRTLQRPWFSGDSNKNRFTLIRSVVWYLDHYKNDPLETLTINDKIAVEMTLIQNSSFKVNNIDILLTGHLDRAVEFNNALYGTDLKTTKHTLNNEYFRDFSPNDQMSGYQFLLEKTFEKSFRGIIIDAAQILVGGTRFLRGATQRTQSQLKEWLRGFEELVDRAYKYHKDNFYPLNEKSCFRCEFREICRSSEQTRDSLLREKFDKREWNPLQDRGDI